MKIGVLGSGAVGREVAERLVEGGHEVCIGTRDPEVTLQRTAPGPTGAPPFPVWHAEHPDIDLVTFSEAGAFGEVLFNATNGLVSSRAIAAVGEEIGGKIVVDLANALDFSRGFPPTVVLGEHGSLGQELQATFPTARFVKVLNTLNFALMFKPNELADGDHTLFMAGDDEDAKTTVRALLESYGWRDIIDLGDISGARGTEMLLPLWLRLYGLFGHFRFQIKIVR
ncbi:MAG: NAD(P)-binding domain-containing protein [Gemmatimonadota bacterium]|nr:NAD(P)-binding domain-containing protein [Gemmatimonadota bacterium]